jgi:thiol-disulfide isomerase/thioredoxin
MTKQTIIIGFLTLVLLASCGSNDGNYTIIGQAPDALYDGQTVFLYDYQTDEIVDSAVIAAGKFTFSGQTSEVKIKRILLHRTYTDVVIESGKIAVDLSNPMTVKGTKLNNQLFKYKEEKAEFDEYIAVQLERIHALDAEEQMQAMDNLREEYFSFMQNLVIDHFNDNKTNVLAPYLLWDGNLVEMNAAKFEELYDQLSENQRDFAPLQSIIDVMNTAKNTAAGMMFTDFTIENGNLDGTSVSFSDYVGKGKYVLVDFWASWCGPCIAEIPKLIEMYQKHHSDKFDILGVAVWDRRENTVQAIHEHKLPWLQIVDAGSIPTELYGIRGIPHIMLVGPDGKIVARDLRGEALRMKIEDVLCDC